MEEKLYYEHIMIENVLHKVITAIEEGPYSKEEKEKYKKEAFERFLKEAKGYKNCPGFQKMNVEQLKEEYEKIFEAIEKTEER